MTTPRGVERLATGVSGLDEITSGGLPVGRSALLTGTTGSGKTLLAIQFLIAGLETEETAVLVTLEERPEDLARNVESLGWDLGKHREAGNLTIVDLTPETGETVTTGDFDFGALIARVQAAITRTRARRVAIDAISGLFTRFSDAGLVRQELARLITMLRETGVTALITAERGEDYGTFGHTVEEFVADTVIVLRNPLAHERRRRTIEILKLRGGEHERGEHPFGIDTRRGVIVIPLTTLESTTGAPHRRASTGVDDLDEMCAGGVPGDAITLVYGPPGAGKSLLGCHFSQAGLDADERVLHYNFEDSAERLLRNAEAIGLPALREARNAGQLSVVARYPERLGLEDLLIEIGRSVNEWKPGRLVIDSLSVLHRVSSGASFREFLVGLITLVRDHQIATLCTQEVTEAPPNEGVVNVATLADCLIALRYREHDGTHQRTLRVVKLRGSSHELAERDYDIGDRGITLAPRPNRR